MIELRGAPVAKAIGAEVERELEPLSYRPRLASVLDASAQDAVAYSRQQRKACERFGLDFNEYPLGRGSEGLIERLNSDETVTSIFLHDPAPPALRELIAVEKDPDRPVPCTAVAVLEILDFYAVGLDGVEVVVVGRSHNVGRPVTMLLLDRRPGPTVTICHSGTPDLSVHTSRADVVIAAAGSPRLVNQVKSGATVIDVGINFVEGELVGDVDTNAVAAQIGAITPVPGGVGPVTVACLLREVVRAAGRSMHSTIGVRTSTDA